LKAAALLVAFASLTINFGLIDLVDGFTGYVDQARNQVLDVGWGAMFGVILPLGLVCARPPGAGNARACSCCGCSNSCVRIADGPGTAA
jgi:hypothetical protein